VLVQGLLQGLQMVLVLDLGLVPVQGLQMALVRLLEPQETR
jgi:hypothetical protein